MGQHEDKDNEQKHHDDRQAHQPWLQATSWGCGKVRFRGGGREGLPKVTGRRGLGLLRRGGAWGRLAVRWVLEKGSGLSPGTGLGLMLGLGLWTGLSLGLEFSLG